MIHELLSTKQANFKPLPNNIRIYKVIKNATPSPVFMLSVNHCNGPLGMA